MLIIFNRWCYKFSSKIINNWMGCIPSRHMLMAHGFSRCFFTFTSEQESVNNKLSALYWLLSQKSTPRANVWVVLLWLRQMIKQCHVFVEGHGKDIPTIRHLMPWTFILEQKISVVSIINKIMKNYFEKNFCVIFQLYCKNYICFF